MSRRVVLLIPDAGPLISLAKADRLGLLLALGLPVVVADGDPETGWDAPDVLQVQLVGEDAPAAPAHGVQVSGSLGAQLLLWEVATAVAGRLLGINPFDQPDVEAAKAAGVFWKQEAEMLRQARAWRLEALDEVLDSINTADVATKTTGLPYQLIAERLLLEIAGRARRLGL